MKKVYVLTLMMSDVCPGDGCNSEFTFGIYKSSDFSVLKSIRRHYTKKYKNVYSTESDERKVYKKFGLEFDEYEDFKSICISNFYRKEGVK